MIKALIVIKNSFFFSLFLLVICHNKIYADNSFKVSYSSNNTILAIFNNSKLIFSEVFPRNHFAGGFSDDGDTLLIKFKNGNGCVLIPDKNVTDAARGWHCYIDKTDVMFIDVKNVTIKALFVDDGRYLRLNKINDGAACFVSIIKDGSVDLYLLTEEGALHFCVNYTYEVWPDRIFVEESNNIYKIIHNAIDGLEYFEYNADTQTIKKTRQESRKSCKG